MTAAADDSRIITTPNILSLSRLALIEVAFPLLKKFGYRRVASVWTYLQLGLSEEQLRKSGKYDIFGIIEARKKLLSIPTLLRERVVSAVNGLAREIYHWKQDHSDLKYEDSIIFYWRSDGSIDRVKTVQQLVLNANIDIRIRFETACEYCLEGSILTLWAEMEEIRKKDFKISYVGIMPFWVVRMRSGSQVPWTKSIVDYLASNRYFGQEREVACSAFFPMLQPADRRRFLSFYTFPRLDDLRLCLYSMSREEQHQMLPICAVRLLSFYAEWPLRSLFMETAEKLWNYIDELSFCKLLDSISDQMRLCETSDTLSLVKGLWKMSPAHFKERARKSSVISRKIDLCLREIRE